MSALGLEKVAALPEVVSISPVIKKMPSNDVATAYTGASALRVREGDEFVKGYTGKGVIIGLLTVTPRMKIFIPMFGSGCGTSPLSR
jgi:hypothetical protein